MGMFDEVLCNHELFGKHKGEVCQTKSLQPFIGGALENFEITPAGQLEFLEYRIEDRSDPAAQGFWRLLGAMTRVLTGGRQDLNYHGWLGLHGIGRAKFTDGSIVGLELSDEHAQSVEPGDSVEPPGECELDTKVTNLMPPASCGDPQHSDLHLDSSEGPMLTSISQYLRTFFRELNLLTPPQSSDMSHAITYQRDSLCLLISVGDCRRKIFIDELDPDPAVAAGKALELWKRVRHGNSPSDFE